MVIYRVRNLVNDKVYVGKTKHTAEERWRGHVSSAREKDAPGRRVFRQPVHRAIRKYGFQSFVLDVLYTAKTIEELNAMETFFIILHQSHKPENGYNLTLGGEGVNGGPRVSNRRGVKLSKETKLRISLANRGRVSNRKGVKLSAATRKKIGESQLGRVPWNKGKSGQVPWNKGKSLGKQTRQSMSDKAKSRVQRLRNEKGQWAKDSGARPSKA